MENKQVIDVEDCKSPRTYQPIFIISSLDPRKLFQMNTRDQIGCVWTFVVVSLIKLHGLDMIFLIIE